MNQSVAHQQKSFSNRIVFALVMALITTSVVVLVTVLSQIGLSEDLFSVWLKTFRVDYPIIVTTIVLFAQPLQGHLFRYAPGEMTPTKRSRIKFALVMASVTVSIACFFGLWLNRGLNAEMLVHLLRIFPFAYLTAVPFILLIAPKLQQSIDLVMTRFVVRQECCN
jgi:hypothetical protein